MIRRPPRSTRTDTLFPYTTLFRSDIRLSISAGILWMAFVSILRASWNADVDYWTLAWPHILQGIGMPFFFVGLTALRSEEHTSELQSLMRISYAVFCLKKKKEPSYYITPRHNTNRE